MEFKAFSEIKKFGSQTLTITQKIHGTNAQVFIVPRDSDTDAEGSKLPFVYEVDGKFYELRVGSRTRWIVPESDNYGFATHVYANKEEFIRTLGPGQHFGEWAGPGVNSGEGLSQKTFVLFDWWKFPAERPLPPQTVVVPVLYHGQMDISKVEETMNDLKTNGSKLAPGFMRPEGVVVMLAGTRYKKVFDAEETQWKKGDGTKERRQAEAKTTSPETLALLQPLRMEKLLSKDESYLRDFPASLPRICSDYVSDLEKEGQFIGSPDDIELRKKALGKHIFGFAKEMVTRQIQIQLQSKQHFSELP